MALPQDRPANGTSTTPSRGRADAGTPAGQPYHDATGWWLRDHINGSKSRTWPSGKLGLGVAPPERFRRQTDPLAARCLLRSKVFTAICSLSVALLRLFDRSRAILQAEPEADLLPASSSPRSPLTVAAASPQRRCLLERRHRGPTPVARRAVGGHVRDDGCVHKLRVMCLATARCTVFG